MDFGWLWCVNVGSSAVTNIPLWGRMLTAGEAVRMLGREYMGTVFSAQFYCEPKTALKIVYFVKNN